MNLSLDTVRNTFDLGGKDRSHKTLTDELVNWVQIRRERESRELESLEGTKKSGIGSDDMDIGALIRRKQQELHNLEDQLRYTQECEKEWHQIKMFKKQERESVDAVNVKGKGKGKGTGFEKLKVFGKSKGFSKRTGAWQIPRRVLELRVVGSFGKILSGTLDRRGQCSADNIHHRSRRSTPGRTAGVV